jgi:hypothetical protein
MARFIDVKERMSVYPQFGVFDNSCKKNFSEDIFCQLDEKPVVALWP